MSLLKDGGLTDKKSVVSTTIARWPAKRMPEGIGMSVKDGWNWGIGFGLAMVIVVPLILVLFGCVIMMGLTMIGGSFGGLF
jgi:hypothetical protein